MSLTVLHVSQPVEAGVPEVVANLARDQTRRGWRVCVACPQRSVLWERLGATDVALHGWEASRSPGPGVVRETAHLGRLMRSVRADIVHLHSSKAGLAGRLASRGHLPTVFQPHAWSFHALKGPLRRGAVMWERFAARYTNALICVSRGEMQEGVAEGVRAPWQVIPNGLDLALWKRPSEGDKRAARMRLGLPPDAPLVVCVGRLSRQKGQDVLLAAWRAVLLALPQARLVLVGDGPAREELEAAASPEVRFAGRSVDVRDWLLAADTVAMPSRWEGSSLVVLEAMATERSVVATDVAGSRESIGPGGGLVIPIEDEGALADGLIRRLQDHELASREGAAGRTRVEEHFDLEVATEAVAAVYEKVLAGRVVS